MTSKLEELRDLLIAPRAQGLLIPARDALMLDVLIGFDRRLSEIEQQRADAVKVVAAALCPCGGAGGSWPHTQDFCGGNRQPATPTLDAAKLCPHGIPDHGVLTAAGWSCVDALGTCTYPSDGSAYSSHSQPHLRSWMCRSWTPLVQTPSTPAPAPLALSDKILRAVSFELAASSAPLTSIHKVLRGAGGVVRILLSDASKLTASEEDLVERIRHAAAEGEGESGAVLMLIDRLRSEMR